MKMNKMITEKDISKKVGHAVKSPIRIGNLKDLGIDHEVFINHFSPFFEELKNDDYAVKAKQINFLKEAFPEDATEIETFHKAYFENKVEGAVFIPWIKKLTPDALEAFKIVSTITRQRNIASFLIEIWDNEIFIERTREDGFEQNVGDFRGWKREFQQADSTAVEDPLFYKLMKKITLLVKEIHPDIRKLQITSHFMRTIAREKIKGENAPEGIHEDGAEYIMSALVVNRHNINGAASQIYEKKDKGEKALIFEKELAPGEFIFQADTGEEYTFGNDLWHYVTPAEPEDINEIGLRDIIGFDIDLLD